MTVRAETDIDHDTTNMCTDLIVDNTGNDLIVPKSNDVNLCLTSDQTLGTSLLHSFTGLFEDKLVKYERDPHPEITVNHLLMISQQIEKNKDIITSIKIFRSDVCEPNDSVSRKKVTQTIVHALRMTYKSKQSVLKEVIQRIRDCVNAYEAEHIHQPWQYLVVDIHGNSIDVKSDFDLKMQLNASISQYEVQEKEIKSAAMTAEMETLREWINTELSQKQSKMLREKFGSSAMCERNWFTPQNLESMIDFVTNELFDDEDDDDLIALEHFNTSIIPVLQKMFSVQNLKINNVCEERLSIIDGN